MDRKSKRSPFLHQKLAFSAAIFSLLSGQVARSNVLDVGFSASVNGTVRAVIAYSGDVLIGGTFTVVNGTSRQYLARLTSTGADGAAMPVVDGPVYAMAVQPDGKLLIAGAFTYCGGYYTPRVARINAALNAVDTTFTSSGPDGSVYALAVETSGTIVIGGDFNYVNIVNRPKLARLKTTGGLVSTFMQNGAPNGTVRAISIHPGSGSNGGKVYIGGDFTYVGYYSASRMARLAYLFGDYDSTFTPPGFDNTVYSIHAGLHDRPGGAVERIAVGGAFTGPGLPYATLLNSGGSADCCFVGGVNSEVRVVRLSGGADIYAGGSFVWPHVGVTRWRHDGFGYDLVDNWNLGPGPENPTIVHAIAFRPDNRPVVGGDFTTFDSSARQRVARLLLTD